MKIALTFLICILSIGLFGQEFEQDQLLVQLSSKSDSRTVLDELAFAENSKVISTRKISKTLNIYQVTFDQNSDLNLLIKASYAYPQILNVQKNHIVTERSFTPNDTFFGDQWHLENTGQTGGIVDADIDATEAWDITTGGLTTHGDTIVVCVIEGSGVDLDHEDLIDNIWVNYQEIPNNGIDDDNNGYVDDFKGWNVQTNDDDINDGSHGTRVSGMIGAVGNNGIGVSGVNHTVKLMVVSGQQASNEASVIAAYSYPLDMRRLYNESNGANGAFVVVTNSSWGINNGNPANSPLWCAMYDSLGAEGVINVGATTNNNSNVDINGDLPSTCSSDYLIAVTASNSNDFRGGTGYGSTHVDLAAPGSSVTLTNSNDNYNSTSGTSFATPCVAGAIALLYSSPCADFISYAKSHPDSAAMRVRSLILDHVDPISNLATEVASGGRLNIFNSISELVNTCSTNSCITPYSLVSNTITDSATTLSWDGLNTTGYVLYLSGSDGSTQTINTGSSTNYQISDLVPCTTYEAYIVGLCGTDSSNQSSTIIFETDGCCKNPNLGLTSSSETTLELYWETVLYATEYVIKYKHQDSLNWIYDTIVNSSFFSLNNLDTCTTYEFAIQTICTDSTRGFGAETLFSTGGCGICYDGNYCEIIPNVVNSNLEWIESVTLNGYTSSTGNDGGYYNGDWFTNGLRSDNSYSITFTPGYSGTQFTEHFSVWLDLNQNGQFDATELLIDNLTSSGPQTGLLIIPNTSFDGVTKMRIGMNGQRAASLCADETLNIFGEYEDYCVLIGKDASITDETQFINIYPNPARDVINIETTEIIQSVSIYGYNGQLVIRQNNSNKKMDTSQLEQGMYLIEVKTSAGKVLKKLVIH